MNETCPSCGATLSDIGDAGSVCPHCGYDLSVNPLGSNPQSNPIGTQRTTAPGASAPAPPQPDPNEPEQGTQTPGG